MSTNKASVIYTLSLVLLLACYMLPFVRMHLDVIKLTVLNLVFIVVFVSPKHGFKILAGASFRLIPFILISFLVSSGMSVKYGIIHKYMMFFNMIVPALLAIDLICRGNKRELYAVFASISIMIAYVLILSYIEILYNPEVLREMTAISVTDEDYIAEMQSKGIGGFGMAYGCGLLMLAYATIVQYIINRYLRIFVYGIIAGLITFIFNANFTTLLFISIICLVLHLLISYLSRGYIIKTVAIMIIFIFGVFYLPTILEFAINYYGDTSIAYHLSDILDLIKGNQVTESERDHISAMLWDGILDNPLWGRNIYDSSTFLLYVNSHSTILGHAYATGIIGIVSYFSALWFVVNKLIVYVGIPKNVYIVLITYYLLLGYFNPSESLEVSICAFLYPPLLCNIIFERYGIKTMEK